MESLRLLQGQTHQTLHSIVLNFLRTPVSSLQTCLTYKQKPCKTGHPQPLGSDLGSMHAGGERQVCRERCRKRKGDINACGRIHAACEAVVSPYIYIIQDAKSDNQVAGHICGVYGCVWKLHDACKAILSSYMYVIQGAKELMIKMATAVDCMIGRGARHVLAIASRAARSASPAEQHKQCEQMHDGCEAVVSFFIYMLQDAKQPNDQVAGHSCGVYGCEWQMHDACEAVVSDFIHIMQDAKEPMIKWLATAVECTAGVARCAGTPGIFPQTASRSRSTPSCSSCATPLWTPPPTRLGAS